MIKEEAMKTINGFRPGNDVYSQCEVPRSWYVGLVGVVVAALLVGGAL